LLTAEIQAIATISSQLIPKHAVLEGHFAAHLFGKRQFRGRNSLPADNSGWMAADWQAT